MPSKWYPPREVFPHFFKPGKDIIPLEKELEHATSYLAIQNIRFKDKFEFSVQADKKLLHYLCPKLSIQPLLENAIYHGMEGVYDDGEITISVYEKDNLIHIDVSDNGLGMPEKVVEYIMHNRLFPANEALESVCVMSMSESNLFTVNSMVSLLKVN